MLDWGITSNADWDALSEMEKAEKIEFTRELALMQMVEAHAKRKSKNSIEGT